MFITTRLPAYFRVEGAAIGIVARAHREADVRRKKRTIS